MEKESEFEAVVASHIKRGQWFLAYDAAKEAMDKFPANLIFRQHAAHALLKVKAVEDAKRILEPLCKPYDHQNPQLRRLYQRARNALRHMGDDGKKPSQTAMRRLSDLIDAAAEVRDAFTGMRATDVETIGLLAGAYKDGWRESDSIQDASDSRDTYLNAYESTGSYWMGINAATMSAVLANIARNSGKHGMQYAEEARSKKLAVRVLDRCNRLPANPEGDEAFWVPATKGEAYLLQGDQKNAVAQYKLAADWAQKAEARDPGTSHRLLVSVTDQLQLLRRIKIPVDQSIFDALKLPTIVVFAGHMLDKPGRDTPRFPKEAENHVRDQIDHVLNELDARIGFTSAACGSDLLFIEAMFDRNAEVNIVLPFEKCDFIAESVAHGGERWIRRFERAIKLSHNHVSYATHERFLHTHDLYTFADKMLASMAFLRARMMGSLPHLLAVFDGISPPRVGGTADIVGRWPDPVRLHVIRPVPDKAPGSTPAAIVLPQSAAANQSKPATTEIPPGTKRTIRTILFADLKGYSALEESQMPAFVYEFFRKLSDALDELSIKPLTKNTWGDAIFAVMDEAFPLVEYARTIQRVIRSTPWTEMGFSKPMNMRIGLHAGPVFQGTDPFTGQPSFFGSHVTRAARVEPVTPPGCIYASQQFVGLLTAEMRARRTDPWPFICEWLGTLDLAKNFGKVPVYHIRERRSDKPDTTSINRHGAPPQQ